MTREFAVQRLRPAGMMQEMADRQRHVDVAALADRLAVVDRFHDREQPLMALHGAADRIEYFRPLIAGSRAPFGQRLARRRDRGLDIGVAGIGDLGEQFSARWLLHVERLAAGGRMPLPADEQCLAQITAGDPGIRLIAGFRGRTVIHGGIAFENVHGRAPRQFGAVSSECGACSRHGVAVVRRIVPGQMVFELAFDVGQQARSAEAEQLRLEPRTAEFFLH